MNKRAVTAVFTYGGRNTTSLLGRSDAVKIRRGLLDWTNPANVISILRVLFEQEQDTSHKLQDHIADPAIYTLVP